MDIKFYFQGTTGVFPDHYFDKPTVPDPDFDDFNAMDEETAHVFETAYKLGIQNIDFPDMLVKSLLRDLRNKHWPPILIKEIFARMQKGMRPGDMRVDWQLLAIQERQDDEAAKVFAKNPDRMDLADEVMAKVIEAKGHTE
jgi:hypothetical protein